MAEPKSDALLVLKSIDASLKQIVKLLQVQKPKEVAADSDLDSQYGDPKVRFIPRDWPGDDYKGCTFSECPPGLLDMLAETFDYFAERDEREEKLASNGKPAAVYSRRDAARARGWAKRLRAGWQPAPMPAAFEPPPMPSAVPADWGATMAMPELPAFTTLTDDDIPF